MIAAMFPIEAQAKTLLKIALCGLAALSILHALVFDPKLQTCAGGTAIEAQLLPDANLREPSR